MPPGVELLIENSAGAGNILGSDPAALGRLLAALPPAVGACVDTAHLWGSGVDVASREGVDCTVDDLDRAIGLERLHVLHVNDSAVGLGSYRDVHAHLGEGRIGLAGLAAWMTHPALRGRPIILETPPEDDPAREAARCAIARLLLRGDVEGAQAPLAVLHAAPSDMPRGVG
jgi:deoxyribonuclease-4